MSTVFLISDTHFGHANILNFTKADGSLMRTKPDGFPFQNVDEMDWFMINNWNSVVKPDDKIYHLGDIAMKKKGVELLLHCNGKKRLIRGNHDTEKTKLYMQYFDEIYGVRVLDGLVLTHIPLHPDSIRDHMTNVHGHLHSNQPQGHLGAKYYNVSVEMIDYTPISLEEVKDRIKNLYGSKAV